MDSNVLVSRLCLIKETLEIVKVENSSNWERMLGCVRELERLVDLLSQEEPVENNQTGG